MEQKKKYRREHFRSMILYYTFRVCLRCKKTEEIIYHIKEVQEVTPKRHKVGFKPRSAHEKRLWRKDAKI